MKKKIRIIGLTGGIGTGKSTAAKLFKKLGFKTLDSDKIAHKLLKKKSVEKEIIKLFGTTSRKVIANKAFGNSFLKKKLEKLLHPLILKEIVKNAKDLTVVEVPLLFEVGWDKKCWKTIVVSCSKKEELKRCSKDFRKRIKYQMPLSKKKKLADYVIDSSGTIKQTELQVKILSNLLS